MLNVVVGTGSPRTITGTFGGDPQAAATSPVPSTNNRLDWVLSEPRDIPGEMTGTFISQDHRRFWVWDASTYYGYHVGVEGGAASLNDACFTMEDLHQSEGIYTRRGTISGCYPFNRPYTGQFYGVGFAESVDYSSPAGLPGFVGRIPGGQSAADGRSPSPIYFYIRLGSGLCRRSEVLPGAGRSIHELVFDTDPGHSVNAERCPDRFPGLSMPHPGPLTGV